MNKKNINKKINKNIFPYVILLIVMLGTMYFFNAGKIKTHKLSYDEMIKEMSDGEVDEITIAAKSGANVYAIEGKLKNYEDHEVFKVDVPLSEGVMERILVYADNQGFEVNTKSNPENSSIWPYVITYLPLILMVVLSFYFFSKLSGGNNKSMDFGKSKAKLSDGGSKVKFDDVAGLKEEKEEVEEIIDFLKNPKKFQKLGARIPKGVLLVGPPGTGKTLLARAVAGEANVPFFFISGSDFVELFVGVGASRVRDMFKEAKRNAPCLIFIDEIDAVGRQRGTGLGGGHDEREQTLNQLLTEMDGFGENAGIIIIAATNRPDVLDPALLRPGRFDRQVTVNLPDSNEREAILKVHAKNKIFDDKVNLKNVGKRTPGFSGADLENLLNESALLAVRRGKENITMSEIDEATDRVLMGPAKTSRKITDKEKSIVALHEAGHAVIGLKYPEANDVHKITIIPRGMAGGYNLMLPKEEKVIINTKSELQASIVTSLGGRAAEELFVGEITTGASGDFKSATAIARRMVTIYGMSDLGPIQYDSSGGDVFLGRDYTQQKHISDQFAESIDNEVKKIIDYCYEEAKKTLKKNSKLVNLISDTLIEKETLTKEQITELVESLEKPKKETKTPKKETKTTKKETKTKKDA